MNLVLPTLMIIIIALIVIRLFLYAYRIIHNPDSDIVQRRIETFATAQSGGELSGLLKTRVLSDVPLFNKILLSIPGIKRLELLVQQVDTKYPVGFFILLTMVLLLAGFFLSAFITKNTASSILIATISGVMPFFYLRLKKKKRMEKFKRQLPEGLELIARALKAGHAFSSGMQLAAAEFDDPLGPEFGKVLNEVNFGSSIAVALKNLAKRVDCPDLKFFVISVIIQRETGGNLAEIIESIAHLIRERFKFQDKIRTLSAEGKLSAIILVALPFLIVIVIHFINPDYIQTLFSEKAGRIMMAVAGSLMALGIVVMRRMVNIKI